MRVSSASGMSNPSCSRTWFWSNRISPGGGTLLRVSPFGPGTNRAGNGGGMKPGLPGVAFEYESAPAGGDSVGVDGGVRLAKIIGGGIVTISLAGGMICVIGGGGGVVVGGGGGGGV